QKYKDYINSSNRQFEVQAIINNFIYGSDEVVEFTVEDMLTGGDELTLGTVIPAKLSIKIKTTSAIPANAKIVPELRLNGAQGYTEWIPMGEFHVDSRQYQNGIWTFSCVDKLITTEQPYVSNLTYPVAMSEVFEEILEILDIESGVVINSAFQIPYKDESISIRDMLSCIASAHGANVKMNREGELIFIPLSPSSPVATITASNYIRAEQTNPQKSYTKLEVIHNAEGETLSRGTGSEDNTLKFENRFMFIEQNQLNYAFSIMNGFSYVPYSMTWTGRPDLDVGDAIKIVLQDATEITSIVAVNKLSFKGGVLQQSSAPSKSEQQSEFQFQGSISKQIAQRLVKDHVYNGVSFGPDYGVRVEDSAKYMRLEMNALDGYKMYLSDDAGNSWEAVFYIIVEDGKPRLYLGGNAEFQGLVKASEFLGGKIEIVKDGGLERYIIDETEGFRCQRRDSPEDPWEDAIWMQDGSANFTGVITGGIIRTAASGARIEISNNQIKTYNSAEQLQGFATNNEGQQYGDVHVYDGDVVVFEIYNNFFGDGVSLRPANGAGLSIGANGHNTRFYGNVADYIWHGTQAQAEAKTDWIDGQYADIEGSKASIGDVINFSLPENVDGSTLTFQECGNRFNEIGYLCNLLTNRLNVIINYLTETTEEMEVDPNL
ncbi:MAG: hypothetical protein GX997_09495, partial [Bacteroidales bacterium]|nr:hypothetical protein [Bacteroidales bacterium]